VQLQLRRTEKETRLAYIYNICMAICAVSATPPACAVATAQNRNRGGG